MKDYGNAIKTLRKKKQMTQATLAASLNISGQAVSKWENNLAQPDFETIVKMTEIFGVTLDEFTALSDSENTTATLVEQESSATAVETPTQPEVAPTLIGVCSNCGVSIYKDSEVGARTPKLICKNCKAENDRKLREERKKQELKQQIVHEYNVKRFKKALIIPAVIIGLLMIGVIIYLCVGYTGSLTLPLVGTIVGGILAYLAVSTLAMEESILMDIFSVTFRKTFAMPGIIFSLDFDGIIWAICVKIGLSILAGLLSLCCTILGFILCMLLSPFCFPYAVTVKIRDFDDPSSYLDCPSL